MSNIPDTQIIQAAMNSEGLITRMARNLRVSPQRAKELLEDCPLAEDALLDARADVCAAANGMLKLAVQQGQRWAVERVLDTWAKPDGLNIVRNIDVTSNGKDLNTGVLVVPPEETESTWSEKLDA